MPLSSVDREIVVAALSRVLDPEVGVPITELDQVDPIDVKGGIVEVDYHLSRPFCPPILAAMVGREIRSRVEALRAVEAVKVVLKDRYIAGFVNEETGR